MNKVFILVALLTLFSATCYTEQVNHTKLEMDLSKVANQVILLSKEEGFRNEAYRDSQGKLTIGIGHLIKKDEDHLKHKTLTDAEVLQLFRQDIKSCSAAVEETSPYELTTYQYEALLSFCFNIGVDNFKKSTVIRNIRNHNFHGAADAMLLWNKPAILEARRYRERELFLYGAKKVAFVH
jgi:lysozyme